MKQRHVLALVVLGMAVATLVLLFLGRNLVPQSEQGSAPEVENADGARALVNDLYSTATPPVVIQRFRMPDEWYAAGAAGQTYTETLSGTGFRVGDTNVLLGQSPPDGPYINWYAIGRGYAAWDTSALPEGVQVLSATLVLELLSSGGRAEPFDFAVYRGSWNTPFTLEDWLEPANQQVGQWRLAADGMEGRKKLLAGQDVALYAPEPPQTVQVSLDSSVVIPGGVTRLELRHAREGIPPPSAQIIPLNPSQIELEVAYRP